MDDLFDYPFFTFRRPLVYFRTPANVENAWMPTLEMYEKDDNYMVRVELPGMKKEDVDISIEGDMLTIRGEKKTESEVKNEDYYRSEFSYGKFIRSITLPSKIDSSKVDASYDNGILEIALPKSMQAKPKKVAIKPKKVKAIEAKPK